MLLERLELGVAEFELVVHLCDLRVQLQVALRQLSHLLGVPLELFLGGLGLRTRHDHVKEHLRVLSG